MIGLVIMALVIITMLTVGIVNPSWGKQEEAVFENEATVSEIQEETTKEQLNENQTNEPEIPMPESSKRELSVSPRILKYLLISLVSGFIILFALEHTGDISFIMSPSKQDNRYSEHYDPVAFIYFTTPFDKRMDVPIKEWTNMDLKNGYSDFYSYSNMVKIYFTATFSDFLFGLLFSGIIFLILMFFSKFKIRIK